MKVEKRKTKKECTKSAIRSKLNKILFAYKARIPKATFPMYNVFAFVLIPARSTRQRQRRKLWR